MNAVAGGRIGMQVRQLGVGMCKGVPAAVESCGDKMSRYYCVRLIKIPREC